jgi:Transposase DDE domain
MPINLKLTKIDRYDRARNRVERFFNKIKQCCRVATRYAKLAANDLAFVQLASIRPWFALAVGLELLVGEHPDQDHGAHHREVK